jgi:hypothetical protein
MMVEGSGSGSRAGSGSIPLTSGSGSGSWRPKNTWIRWIRIRIRIRNIAYRVGTANKFIYTLNLSFCAYFFLKVHLYHFSKIERQKEVTKQ